MKSNINYKMNKKGLGPLVIPIIIGTFLLVGILGGWLTSSILNQVVSSPFVILIIFFLVLYLIFGGKKKK